ncbi:cysteine peptidase family C39 domain-containing protein [Lyngbya aestuarii]|uniref:cysteine peptidase family C39 domain-containing protein n=1 Tax=Lyngbya aestuarii TaxID=118322 RepID=UPI00403D7F2B
MRLSQTDATEASQLTQAFEAREFQLGDTLYSYNPLHLADNSATEENDNLGLYLICQGRVRLLGLEKSGSREVSAMVLEAGESFGTETLFADIPSLRQAIAASDTQVAWIPLTQLQSWLERLPNLQEYLRQTALTRQRLIFFKTSTDWRRLPAAQLQEVLPYLRETTISAGEALVASSASGRFWLCSGEISQGEQTSAPSIGESWGYPHATPAEWIAQTDLLVYQLPQEHWQAVENAGISFDSPSSNSHHSPQDKTRVVAKVRTAPALRSRSPASEPQAPPPPNSPAESVVFPKPSKQGYRVRSFWQRYPFIQQQSAADCGAASLAMISRYWGKTFSLNYLRNLANVVGAGASLKSLANGAESLGFQARPVRASLSRLVEQKNPWIAHWQGDHYVVVYRVKGDRVLMADPGVGKRLVTRQEFLAGWTGYALLLDPTERLEAVPNQKTPSAAF